MSANKAFVDTNVLIYLYSGKDDDSGKRRQAYEAVKQYDCQISTQVLNEFNNICIKKLKITAQNIQDLIDQICSYDLKYSFVFSTLLGHFESGKNNFIHGKHESLRNRHVPHFT